MHDRRPQDPVRPRRFRPRPSAGMALLLIALSGCGGVGGHPGRLRSAIAATPAARTTVLPGTDPATLSAEVSHALLRRAPVVVVAAAGDRGAVTRAAAQATRLRAPLLLTGQPGTAATDSASPGTPHPSDASTYDSGALDAGARGAGARGAGGADAHGADAGGAGAGRAGAVGTHGVVAGEVRRLRARDVLAVGGRAAHRLRAALRSAPDGVSVVTDERALPPVPPPRGIAHATLLVHARDDAPTEAIEAAATATAHAVGATVVRVHGDDPRADPAAISALHRNAPQHVLAVGGDFGPRGRLADRVTVAAAGRQLPGGGQVLFPGRRLVALYGQPGAPALGVLGAQGLRAGIHRAKRLAARYDGRGDVPAIPTFEIIATSAQRSAGPDGDYSAAMPVAALRPWIERATDAGMYVVLDLQSGRADPLDQAKRYSSLLRLPNVGLALDAEWHLGPGQLPLRQIGSLSAARINRVADWLSRLAARHHLPQKLLVLHQFRLSMITEEDDLDTGHDNLVLLIHMDGQGTPQAKQATWRTVTRAAPDAVHWFGWKNFYRQDHPMLTPAQTMSKHPTPVMITYQ